MADDERELAYYRAIEDLFATLRGIPHVLSPRDFHLMRTWWRDDVPLQAVATGVTEVFARRRERGDGEPVVSLGYCRHAVRSHARRLAEMRVGEQREERPETRAGVAESLDNLTSKLTEAADRARSARPSAAAVSPGVRALRDRLLRELLGLPRLELEP